MCLEIDVRNKGIPEVSQSLEPKVWIADKGGAVLVRVVLAGCYEGEAVVCWCHAALLHVTLKHYVRTRGEEGREGERRGYIWDEQARPEWMLGANQCLSFVA